VLVEQPCDESGQEPGELGCGGVGRDPGSRGDQPGQAVAQADVGGQFEASCIVETCAQCGRGLLATLRVAGREAGELVRTGNPWSSVAPGQPLPPEVVARCRGDDARPAGDAGLLAHVEPGADPFDRFSVAIDLGAAAAGECE